MIYTDRFSLKLKSIFMKKISFFCILAFLFIAGCTQKKPIEKTILGMGTDYWLYPETLKGKVKEVKEQNYWAIEKDGKMTKGDLMTWKDLDSIGSTKNFVAYFDTAGVLTRIDRLDDDNSIRYSSIGIFENGRCIRMENKLKDSTYSYQILEYDNLGYFIGGSYYRPINDTLLSKAVLTHDGKGNYTKIESFNPKNERTSLRTLTLNNEGKVIDVKFFNKNDSLMANYINTYDDKGFIIRTQSIIENPRSTSTWDMKNLAYDDHGNLLECFSNIDDGKYKIMLVRSYIYY